MPLWRVDGVADATFGAVAWTIGALGYDVVADAGTKVIGADGFFVSVAPACSGVEGIALVAVAATIHLALFRRELRFPRALLLYPVGIALAALFNVVRIAVLLVNGIVFAAALALGRFEIV